MEGGEDKCARFIYTSNRDSSNDIFVSTALQGYEEEEEEEEERGAKFGWTLLAPPFMWRGMDGAPGYLGASPTQTQLILN